MTRVRLQASMLCAISLATFGNDQEVRRACPHLDRAEGMLNRLTPAAHGLGILIQPLLRCLDNVRGQP